MPVSAFSTAPTQRPGSLLLDRLWRDRRIFEPGSFAPRRQFVSPRKRSENERFGQNPRKAIYYSVEKGPTLGLLPRSLRTGRSASGSGWC